MKIDCINNVTTDLSVKICQTKNVLTEVDLFFRFRPRPRSYVLEFSNTVTEIFFIHMFLLKKMWEDFMR